MSVLYKAKNVVDGALEKCALRLSVVKPRELATWKCVPLRLSYGCEVPEGKDMYDVRHGEKTMCWMYGDRRGPYQWINGR